MNDIQSSTWKEVEAHAVNSVASALEFRDPFLHLSLNNIFPTDAYMKLLTMLPSTDCYSDLRHPDALRPDGTSTRVQLSLAPKFLKKLPTDQQVYWRAMCTVLMSEAFQHTLFQKLASSLNERFDSPVGDIAAFPCPALNRDTAGYRITPHTDNLSKVVTVLIYLADSESQSELGTTIYKQSEVHAREFHPVRSMPFISNSGLAFAVSRSSWHGRETIPDNVKERNTIALTYFTDKRTRGF